MKDINSGKLLFSFLVILFALFVVTCDNKNPVNNDINTNDSTFKDIDGNVYHTVKIGDQVWSVENMRVEHFNDGTPIQHIKETDEWRACSTGVAAFCYYGNDQKNKEKYGALYNWYAINTGKLAPEGWRVPSNKDWQELKAYLIENGYNWDSTTTGNKIAKSMASKTDWIPSDTVGDVGNDQPTNNSSGFTGFPGGYRDLIGTFENMGKLAPWWSTDFENIWEATHHSISSVYYGFGSYNLDKMYGCGVRLVKDRTCNL